MNRKFFLGLLMGLFIGWLTAALAVGGGAYFFLPGLNGLRYLAALGT